MDKKIVCPRCGKNDRMYLASTNQKLGTAVGGGVGAVGIREPENFIFILFCWTRKL